MSNGLSIVGSSRANGEREKNDFYPTPEWATIALMEREEFNGSVWECACGDGSMSEVIKKYNSVESSDIIDRNYGEVSDFFTDERRASNIITNPPFKYGQKFVERAKLLVDKKIAMFLKTVFLESATRYKMFQDKKFPLKTVYQFSKRVNIYKNGVKMKNSGLVAYAWFVWDKEYIGKPQINWIKED